MSYKTISSLIASLFLGLYMINAQDSWPKDIPLASGGKITMYQPQPEDLQGNTVAARAAVSVRRQANDEPVFGAVWMDATLDTDRDSRMADLESIVVKEARFGEVSDGEDIEALKNILETEIPKWELEISMDRLAASLEKENPRSSENLKMAPPKVIYREEPSLLILIDGQPKVEQDDNIKMERVINTPYLIVKDKDYYLSAGDFWYQSNSITSGWTPTTKLPKKVNSLDKELKKAAKENGVEPDPDAPTTPPGIIVSTEAAELLQTDGEAEYKSIEGTTLLYVSNSENQIFKDINTQKNYILIAGRWYASASLNGPWTFVAADKLPPDFAKIPEGSEKDIVLANVAGTEAARDAVMDAQIPQTAKVDRKTASTSVVYDGKPKFEPIKGTSLQLAMNTSSTVLISEGQYYTLDNGIWFISSSPTGPWEVANERPADVENIPPDNPAYNN